MFRPCDFAKNDIDRCRRKRRRCRFIESAGVLKFAVLLICAVCGCHGPTYTVHSLPLDFQAPALPPSTELNLERMGGWAVGSSLIDAGDLVAITVYSGSGDEKTTPFPARVAEDGTVMVPLIGAVPIGGLEPVAAEQRIASAGIERGVYRQPYVTLTVTEHSVNRVTVMGAVAKPGVVELPRGSSDLASALAAAGGLSADAGTQVEILHRGSPAMLANRPADQPAQASSENSSSVKLAAYNQLAPPFGGPTLTPLAPNQQPAIQPAGSEMTRVDLAQVGAAAPEGRKLNDRDMVMVQPRDKRYIHVTGLVAKPNQFELTRDRDIRVLDAIAMAGGATSVVADKVFVIRQLPNMSQPAVIKISMWTAKRNGEENLRLAAGDLVSVESTPATMMVDTVGKFFRVALGFSGTMSGF
jgi:polysaccharide export outer membrane protein